MFKEKACKINDFQLDNIGRASNLTLTKKIISEKNRVEKRKQVSFMDHGYLLWKGGIYNE